jgi:hypothetical protein
MEFAIVLLFFVKVIQTRDFCLGECQQESNEGPKVKTPVAI